MRREPGTHGVRVEAGGKVVDDPQEGLLGRAELVRQGGFHFRRLASLDRNGQRDGNVAELVAAARFALLRGAGRPIGVVAERAQPEDTAREGGAEAQGIFLSQQRFAVAAESGDLRRTGRGSAGDDGAFGFV